MILLWLALGLLDKQPIEAGPQVPTFVGSALRFGQQFTPSKQEARAEVDSITAEISQESTISAKELADIVEYHAHQRARVAASLPVIGIPMTPIAASVSKQILPSPAELNAMIQREMEFLRKERARQLLIAQESEMLEAAQIALMLMLEES